MFKKVFEVPQQVEIVATIANGVIDNGFLNKSENIGRKMFEITYIPNLIRAEKLVKIEEHISYFSLTFDNGEEVRMLKNHVLVYDELPLTKDANDGYAEKTGVIDTFILYCREEMVGLCCKVQDFNFCLVLRESVHHGFNLSGHDNQLDEVIQRFEDVMYNHRCYGVTFDEIDVELFPDYNHFTEKINKEIIIYLYYMSIMTTDMEINNTDSCLDIICMSNGKKFGTISIELEEIPDNLYLISYNGHRIRLFEHEIYSGVSITIGQTTLF